MVELILEEIELKLALASFTPDLGSPFFGLLALTFVWLSNSHCFKVCGNSFLMFFCFRQDEEPMHE